MKLSRREIRTVRHVREWKWCAVVNDTNNDNEKRNQTKHNTPNENSSQHDAYEFRFFPLSTVLRFENCEWDTGPVGNALVILSSIWKFYFGDCTNGCDVFEKVHDIAYTRNTKWWIEKRIFALFACTLCQYRCNAIVESIHNK